MGIRPSRLPTIPPTKNVENEEVKDISAEQVKSIGKRTYTLLFLASAAMSTDASNTNLPLNNEEKTTTTNVNDSSDVLYPDPNYMQFDFIKEARYRDRLRCFFKALQRQSCNETYCRFKKRYVWFCRYMANLEPKCKVLEKFTSIFDSGDSAEAVSCFAALCVEEDNSPLFKQFFDEEMDLLIYMVGLDSQSRSAMSI